MNTFIYTDQEAYNDLTECTICPRSCKVDRTRRKAGYCKTDAGFNVSSICIHKGEEPVISGTHGICNVFFGHCNLQCIFCQNYQISQNGTSLNQFGTIEEITQAIISNLEKGCKAVGFVSPSHMVPQMIMIINSLHRKNYYPTIVYNSNGFDKVETLKKLEGIIDIYLPDFKYSSNVHGNHYSDVENYYNIAFDALKEMYRQMGPVVISDDQNTAIRGLIVRHLVLPGHVENSINILKLLASEFSTKLSISLMSQYNPGYKAVGHGTLGNTLSKEEYMQVCKVMEDLGFRNGWIQEMDSNIEYLPDFSWEHPFERSA